MNFTSTGWLAEGSLSSWVFFLFMLFHSYPHITTFRRLRALKPQHQIDQIGYRSNLGPSPPKMDSFHATSSVAD